MISFVIVSHSARLAEGVRELAEQMTQGRVQIAVAGGIDDPDNPIGTDPMKVQAAIEAVSNGAPIVVLMDLGSAVMSAETALEFLPNDLRERVHLVEAPLVEGTLAAAVTASTGASLEQVLQEARAALLPKQAALGVTPAATAEADEPVITLSESADQLLVRVPNALGLHARPAARLVQIVGQYDAIVRITLGERTVNASSMSQVATLGARQGDTLDIRARGPQAAAVLAALRTLVEANFGDDDSAITAPPHPTAATVPATEGQLVGIPASPGVALGTARWLQATLPNIPKARTTDPSAECTRLQLAIQATAADLARLAAQTGTTAGQSSAAIFEAQRLLASDPALYESAVALIKAQRLNGAAAWWSVMQTTADEFRALPDPYLQARAADALDVGRQVIARLTGASAAQIKLDKPAILLASELTPSDTARLDRQNILGIITELGGATSHSAILARGLGIPAVVGVGEGLRQLKDGAEVGLDGSSGQITTAFTPAIRADLKARVTAWKNERNAQRAAAALKGETADGLRIEVAANIGNPADARTATDYGAEGVGLFRTEFLYMNRSAAPTETEQYAAYVAAGKAMAGQPVIIRTLDVGGDKPIPYLGIEHEENPFLGWRALRYCLENIPLFRTQLRAICRASASYPIRLMFPMVSTVDEVRRARALLREVHAELDAARVPFDAKMPVGIMIEVPSAVFYARELATEVDFFSIGTNDLTQYIMAADRGNPHVAPLADALHPAVLRAVAQVAQAGTEAGIWTGMCGELAGNPLATPVLVGLGLTELSMSAPSILAVKQRLRQFTLAQAQEIARAVLALDSAGAVRAYLQEL